MEIIQIEKEKCIKRVFEFIDKISMCGLYKGVVIRVKLFEGCMDLYSYDGDWWFSESDYCISHFYREKDNYINVDWFTRTKCVFYSKIEEVWLNDKPLYLNGKKCLGDNLYSSAFSLTLDFCKEHNLEYWGRDIEEEIIKKRPFLRT